MLESGVIKFLFSPRAVVFDTPEAAPAKKADVEAARKEGYQRGFEEASMLLQRQLLEQRDDVLHLQQKTFSALEKHHASLITQLGQALPNLTMEAIRRIVAGVELDGEMIVRIVNELLAEIHPGPGALEVSLSEHDLRLIAANEESFRSKYPGIHFSSDPGLSPGDCVVRSLFGTIDGRMATKLKTMEAMLQ